MALVSKFYETVKLVAKVYICSLSTKRGHTNQFDLYMLFKRIKYAININERYIL